MTVWFVARDGADGNSGLDRDSAFRHVGHGISQLDTGDTLLIAGGVYTEHVTIHQKSGVTIRSLPGEHAIIDGARDDFREAPDLLWKPGSVPGEFVSVHTSPPNTIVARSSTPAATSG